MKFCPETRSGDTTWIEDLLGTLLTLTLGQDPLVICSVEQSVAPRDGLLLRVRDEQCGQLLFRGEGILSPENLNARHILASGKNYFPRISLEMVAQPLPNDQLWSTVVVFDSQLLEIGTGLARVELPCSHGATHGELRGKLREYFLTVYQCGAPICE